MSADDWMALDGIAGVLAPLLGLILAGLIVDPPQSRTRTQRRRDREQRMRSRGGDPAVLARAARHDYRGPSAKHVPDDDDLFPDVWLGEADMMKPLTHTPERCRSLRETL